MPADSMCEYNWLHTLSKLAVVNEDDDDDDDDKDDEEDEDDEDEDEEEDDEDDDADADERVSSCCCNKEGCEGNRGRCVS